MTSSLRPRRVGTDLLYALQFLTRIPLPAVPHQDGSLARAAKFFPVVGAVVGAGAAMVAVLLNPHLPRTVVAAVVLVFLVLITGGLHEDALADAADGFGGGWSREQVLLIMRDSRIGSYGGLALALSVLLRFTLISGAMSAIPASGVFALLITAHVLCRWSFLPLSFYLPSARDKEVDAGAGLGARVARLTTAGTLVAGSLFSFAVAGLLLRRRAIAPIVAVMLVTLITGAYYKRRIGGVTGDCFGATSQLAEIAVYVCGVWVL